MRWSIFFWMNGLYILILANLLISMLLFLNDSKYFVAKHASSKFLFSMSKTCGSKCSNLCAKIKNLATRLITLASNWYIFSKLCCHYALSLYRILPKLSSRETFKTYFYVLKSFTKSSINFIDPAAVSQLEIDQQHITTRNLLLFAAYLLTHYFPMQFSTLSILRHLNYGGYIQFQQRLQCEKT